MFEVLKIKRGEVCEVCSNTQRLGTFHVLPKSTAPRLRYNEENLLLVCWKDHFLWHQDYFRAKAIEKRIKELRGKDYEIRLRALNAISPPLNTLKLEQIRFALEHFVKHGEVK
jgi:hypothetical protein